MSRVFAVGLGDQNMIIEDVAVEVETPRGRSGNAGEVLVFAVRPKVATARRCSRCLRRCPGYDGGDGMRRWRTLLAAFHPRRRGLQIRLRRADFHGVVVAHVPWARPGATHTHLSRTPAPGWPRTPR